MTERTNTTVRILIVDVHALVRDGWSRLLDGEKDVRVVGEAAVRRMAHEAVDAGLLSPAREARTSASAGLA